MKAYIAASNNIDFISVLEQLREDIKNLPNDIEVYTQKIFNSKEVQEFIIAANIRNLEKGLRPDLTPIEKKPEGKQTSNFYERLTEYNRSEGKSGYEPSQSLYVDLHKTGFFYESLKVRSGSSELLEFSSDPKSAEIERVWGNILGISSEDLNELILMLQRKIIKFVNVKLKQGK